MPAAPAPGVNAGPVRTTPGVPWFHTRARAQNRGYDGSIPMSEVQSIKRELKGHALILGGVVALLWALEAVDALSGQALDVYGVVPRTLTGLRGIVLAPFLHGGFGHLIANTVPLVVLGWLVMLRQTRDFFTVWGASALVGGLGTWLIAPSNTVHIGASVVVFGFLGYLIARGWFERNFGAIAVALVAGGLYGGAIFGILPGQIGISWQGHLFGLIGGVLAAKWMSARRPAPLPALRAT
jgi:membrane associated rhomboid family serine protease